MSLEHAPSMSGKARTISIAEAAEIMGVSSATAYEAARKGQIPTIRMGRLWRIPLAALERMLEGEGA